MRGLLVFISLIFCVVSQTVAGDRGGNGADQRPEDDGAAWFLGAAPIRYCFVLSPTFGVKERDIKATVADAFNTWRVYIKSKRINEPEITSSYSDPLNPIGKLQVRSESQYYGPCDGKEDLRFYFGVSTNLTEKYRHQYYNPTAFAQRLTYDPSRGWGKGFIWIAPPHSLSTTSPNWQLPNRLKGIILHEIGHVLGNRHVDGTIMDENIAMWIPQKDLTPSATQVLFTQIDQFRELYMCDRCGFDVGNSQIDNLDSRSAFETFVGKAPQGQVLARITKALDTGSETPFILILQDDKGRWEFPILFSYDVLSRTNGEIPIFKKAVAISSGSLKSKWLTTNSVSYSASLQTVSGQPIELVINRNENLGLIAIQYRLGDRHKYFFVGSDNYWNSH